MIFFDDMMENINDVSKLNVLSIHTPNGFLLDNWNKALELYNKNWLIKNLKCKSLI